MLSIMSLKSIESTVKNCIIQSEHFLNFVYNEFVNSFEMEAPDLVVKYSLMKGNKSTQ